MFITLMFIVCGGLCVAGLVRPNMIQDMYKDKPVPSKKEWVTTWVSVFILCALLSTCFGGEDADEKKMPEGSIEDRIKFISANVESVNQMTDVLQITHTQKTIWSGNSWVSTFASDAKQILSKLDEASKGKKYKTVAFMVKIPTRDKLGNEGSDLGMKVFYEMSDLVTAKYNNMTDWDILDVAQKYEFRLVGYQAAAEYCQDEDNAKYASRFCAAADRL